jgi:hypothetical protein
MPNNTNASDENGRVQQNEKEKEGINVGRRIWDAFFNGKSPAWTAIFTGVLVVFTFLLYKVGDRSVSVAKSANDTSRTSQRAFLSVSNIGVGPHYTSPDGKTVVSQEAQLAWSNDGTTPAKKAIASVSEQFSPSDLPEGFDYHDLGKIQPPVGIAPKQTGIILFKIPINDIRNGRENPQSRIFVWGWAVYNDAFPGDPPRLTEFCKRMFHSFIPAGKDVADPNVQMGWDWIACPTHNCYDEDCADYDARIKAAQSNR